MRAILGCVDNTTAEEVDRMDVIKPFKTPEETRQYTTMPFKRRRSVLR
jgi:hypothetical protein